MDHGVGTTSEARPAAQRAAVWVAVAITGMALFGGFLVKDRCARDLGWAGWQYSSNCYSDITALYTGRGFEKNHPIAYRNTNLEYPALTGLFITVVNAPVSPSCERGRLCATRGFFVANVVALAPFGLLGAAALASIATRRWRILYFAAAPAILAYAFHNWDLIPVGLTAAAMWAFTKRRDGLAGILLGLGAAAKLYPAFIVPVFLLARFRERDRDGIIGVLAGAAGGFIVPNLVVFLLGGFEGWWYPWQFQGKRFPNFETSWFFIYRHLGRSGGAFWFETYPAIAQWSSTAIFIGAAGLLLWREMRRERFRPFVAAMGMVLLFVITAKVFSPQYALWLLPFFVVAAIPWWGYGLFVVSDMFVLSAIWWYLTARQYPAQLGTPAGTSCEAFAPCASGVETRLSVLEAAVWSRYAVLLVLLWLSRRAPEHAGHAEAPSPTVAASSA